MLSLKSLLPQALKRYKIASQVEANFVLEEFKKIARDIVGPELAKDIEPLYVKNNTLTVKVRDASLMSELRLYSSQIIEYLEDKLRKKAVEQIRFVF